MQPSQHTYLGENEQKAKNKQKTTTGNERPSPWPNECITITCSTIDDTFPCTCNYHWWSDSSPNVHIPHMPKVQVQCCFTSTETIRTIGDGEPRMATLIFTQLLSSDIPKILHIALVRIRSRRRDDKSPTLVVLTRIRRDCGSHSLGGGGQHELHRYRSLHLTPTPCCTQSQCLTTAWQRQGGWFEDGGEWLRMSGAGHHFGLGSQDGAGADAGYGSWQQLEHG